jgi:hypothetical protein
VDSRLPQDLVGGDVPEPRDDLLVHEHGLDSAAVVGEELVEAGVVDVERIRALVTHDPVCVALVTGEPDPLQLALIPVPQFPVLEDEDNPVVRVVMVSAGSPDELARHPEVHQQRGPVRTGNQPFPVSTRVEKTAVGEVSAQSLAADVAQHRGVEHVDTGDALPAAVAGQESPEMLDLGELGHRVPSDPQADAIIGR